MYRISRSLLACLLLAAFAMTGCNVFDSLSSEGTSDDPHVLIEDARYALERGEPAKAVTYLRKAVEKEPDNVRARAKLSVTLLEANDFDVQTLVDFATSLTGGDAAVALAKHRAATASSSAAACTFDPSAPGLTAGALAVQTTDEYQQIIAMGEALEEAWGNAAIVLDAVEAAAGDPTDPDTQQWFATLVEVLYASGRDMTPAEAEAEAEAFLAASGLAGVFEAFYTLHAEGLMDEVTLYELAWSDGSEGVGACATDESVLGRFEAAAACIIPQLKDASHALRARADNLGARAGDDLPMLEALDKVDEIVAEYEAEFGTEGCVSPTG